MKNQLHQNHKILTGGRNWGMKFLQTIFAMQNQNNHPKTGTFNLQNATAQDLRQMIESGNLPGFLSANQKERIQELYNSGHTFDSIRKLQGLIDGQNGKQGKSLL